MTILAKTQEYFECFFNPIEVDVLPPGRAEALAGLSFSFIAIRFAPIIFGPLGVTLGLDAVKKGSKKLGWLAVSLSIIFMGVGVIRSLRQLTVRDNVGMGDESDR